ncbi:unnamed protein product, partial [Discosporangium mesarthrocarpum]
MMQEARKRASAGKEGGGRLDRDGEGADGWAGSVDKWAPNGIGSVATFPVDIHTNSTRPGMGAKDPLLLWKAPTDSPPMVAMEPSVKGRGIGTVEQPCWPPTTATSPGGLLGGGEGDDAVNHVDSGLDPTPVTSSPSSISSTDPSDDVESNSKEVLGGGVGRGFPAAADDAPPPKMSQPPTRLEGEGEGKKDVPTKPPSNRVWAGEGRPHPPALSKAVELGGQGEPEPGPLPDPDSDTEPEPESEAVAATGVISKMVATSTVGPNKSGEGEGEGTGVGTAEGLGSGSVGVPEEVARLGDSDPAAAAAATVEGSRAAEENELADLFSGDQEFVGMTCHWGKPFTIVVPERPLVEQIRRAVFEEMEALCLLPPNHRAGQGAGSELRPGKISELGPNHLRLREWIVTRPASILRDDAGMGKGSPGVAAARRSIYGQSQSRMLAVQVLSQEERLGEEGEAPAGALVVLVAWWDRWRW